MIQRTFFLAAAVLVVQLPTSSAARPESEQAQADDSRFRADAMELRNAPGTEVHKKKHESHSHSGSEHTSGHAHGAKVSEGQRESQAHSGSEHPSGHGHGHSKAHSDSGHGSGHGHGHSQAHSGSEHGSGHTHGHEHVASEGDIDNALGLVASACMVPMVVFFALTPGPLSAMTLKLLDVFVSIFLAVIWYSVFEQFVITFRLKDRFKGGDHCFFFLVIATLYATACRICFKLRDEAKGLIIFGGCAGHFVAFAAIGWALDAQSDFAALQHNPAPRIGSFVFCLVPVLISCLVFFITRKAFLDKFGHHELTEVVEELQLDVICLVLTYVVTQAVGHSCLGFFPATDQHESMEQLEGTGHFLLSMSIWMSFLIAVSYTTFPKIHHMLSCHVQIHFVKTSLLMLLAWAYLLVAHVLFHHFAAHRGEMFMQESFSIITTFLALMVLLVIHKLELSTGRWHGDALETRNISITAIALTAAWSWEHCFKEAFEIVGQRYQVGYKGLVPKTGLALLLPMFMLPPYVSYIKVAVIENDKAAHGSHHGQEGHSNVETHLDDGSVVASKDQHCHGHIAETVIDDIGSGDAHKK